MGDLRGSEMTVTRPSIESADILPGTERVAFSLSMLGWALNEEESLGAYIDRAGAFLAALTDDYELILIDDGSTDRTWAIAQDYQRTRPWLKTHKNERNRGAGYNTKRAVSLATKDYVFWQTVDWSYDIRHLAMALPRLKDVDVLQGARTDALTLHGLLDRRSDTAYKGLVSLVNYWLIRLLFRLPISDYQNVTVYPRPLIQSIQLESESSFTNPECLLKVWWRGARFQEVPVPFVKREKGVSKGTRPRAVLAAIGDILYWWSQWRVLRRRADRQRGSVIRAE
jgi:glycosyltransferase involved in cell wall biosynthesis